MPTVQHLADNGRRWSRPGLVRPMASTTPRWEFLGPNRWFLADGTAIWETAAAGRSWYRLAALPGGFIPAEISFVAR